MANFYDILGVGRDATPDEIRNAFRRLAMQFHPDKNESGKEKFEQILKAYQTLSDQDLKASYDYRLSFQTTPDAPASKKSKQWKFDEAELKRRNYYNEHIRKYEKATQTFSETKHKGGYNEFKYILLAMPLAVAIFVFIMNVATSPLPSPVTTAQPTPVPIESFFGVPMLVKSGASLIITNPTQQSQMVFVFTDHQFVRSAFLRSHDTQTMTELPVQLLSIRFCQGDSFEPSKVDPGIGVLGGFTSTQYFQLESPFRPDVKNKMILDANNASYHRVDEKTFFNKNT